jgi:hypothetical protein
VPGGASTELSPVHAAVLRLCDGEHRACDIARAIVPASAGRLSSETQVLALLKQLEAKNVLTWGFDIPFTLHPHETLRTLFESVEPEALRTPAIAALDALDAARLDVERAAGDPERLDTALQALERTFTNVTGQAPTRAAGAVYAARTLVYQDGMRDAKVDLGTKLLDDLGPPLSLLLTSTRWFTAQAAAAFRRVFDRIYREMEAQRGPNGIELITFWLRAEPLLFNPAAGLLQPIVDDFQDRWRQLLAAPAGLRHVTRTAAELRPHVEDVFAAPPAPWQGGRYHSPDIMIAADSVEAIERGDYAFVLGELHAAVNTIRGSFAVAQHPRPEELFAALEADADRPSLLPVLPRQWPRLTNRTTVALVSPRDYHCELSRHSLAGAPRDRVLPISSLIVDRTSAGLVVRTRDGRLSFDIVDAFGETLSLNTLTRLSLFPRERYRPRISLDRLVISREAWTIDAATLPFPSLNDESARYLAARRWRQQLGLPRLAFVKVAIEPKPFFLDFDSPIYVEIFTKIARRVLASDDESHDIAISEMLPSPSQLWLSDAHGHRYTSELRIVARDCAAAEKQG